MAGALLLTPVFGDVLWEKSEESRAVLDVVNEIEVEFPFLNQSETPLSFTTLEADCPCVSLKAEPELTAPHGKGSIRARIDLRPYKGDGRKTIRATTTGGIKDLTVSIQVTPAVKITPRVVWWTEYQRDERVVTLALANPQVEITKVISETENIPFKLTRKSELEWELRVSRFSDAKDAMAKLAILYKVGDANGSGSVVAIVR